MQTNDGKNNRDSRFREVPRTTGTRRIRARPKRMVRESIATRGLDHRSSALRGNHELVELGGRHLSAGTKSWMLVITAAHQNRSNHPSLVLGCIKTKFFEREGSVFSIVWTSSRDNSSTISSRMYQQSCCYKFQMKFELRMAS